MAYLNTQATAPSSLLQSFERATAWLSLRIKQRRMYRATINELSALTARELADLGIDRSEIRGIALDAAELITE